MPIFRIGRLKTTDTNNGLLVSGGKFIIIGIGYCYQSTSIIDPRFTINRFSSSAMHQELVVSLLQMELLTDTLVLCMYAVHSVSLSFMFHSYFQSCIKVS
jgi:hypothetical protein